MRVVVAAAVALGVAVAAVQVHDGGLGRERSFALVLGLLFGFVLQRSRFCFASAFRDLFLLKDRRAALGVVLALAIGCVGYQVVFGTELPDPTAGYLPYTGHIAPLGWHLVIGGVAFGIGMSIAGGCVSGNLYRLGEGSPAALIALVGAVVGIVLGYVCWNPIYLHLVGNEPWWLPAKVGYAWALALQLGALALIAAALLHFMPAPPPRVGAAVTLQVAMRRLFRDGWPTWAGGAAVGAIATLAAFRREPLGVTAELSRLARAIGDALGLLPERIEGLDKIRGCAEMSGVEGLSINGLFVVALVAGSFVGALAAGEFRVRRIKLRALALSLVGGILLGFGAMLARGCTIGTLLSGVMAHSLSGWLFAVALLAGAFCGARLLRRLR